MSDFDALVGAIDHGYLSPDKLPAVSFLKAPGYQDGHAGYSDPLDEQKFIVNEVNAIEKSKYWDSTAIVITYDDSDGWYDHVAPPIVNGSNDATQDSAICTAAPVSLGTNNDRCGFSQRLPFVVISPFTKPNLTPLILNPTTGAVVSGGNGHS
jgi:phospholipase C